MSLLFTLNSSNRVTLPTAGAIMPDVVTILTWIYPTTIDATFQSVIERTPSGYGDYRGFGINNTNGEIAAYMRRGSPAYTGIDVKKTGVLSANLWQFVGVQMDASGTTNTNQKIFYGSLTIPVAELTGYGVQTAGSGVTSAPGTEATIIGNNAGSGFTEGFPGRIAWVATWSRLLTLGEIIDQQFNPHPTANCEMFMHLFGTGTQVDLSGHGRNGTVTGATADAHVPLGKLF